MPPPRRRPPTLPRSRRASSLSRRFARRSSGDFRDGARLFCRPKRSASLTAPPPSPTTSLLDALRMGRIIRGQRKGAGSIFTSNTSKRKGVAQHRQAVRTRDRTAFPLPRVIRAFPHRANPGTSLTLPSPFPPTPGLRRASRVHQGCRHRHHPRSRTRRSSRQGARRAASAPRSRRAAKPNPSASVRARTLAASRPRKKKDARRRPSAPRRFFPPSLRRRRLVAPLLPLRR